MDSSSGQLWESKGRRGGTPGAGVARATGIGRFIDDEILDVRIEAAFALDRAGSHSEKAVPVSTGVLQRHSDQKKYLAVLSLGITGAGMGVMLSRGLPLHARWSNNEVQKG